MSFFRIKEYQGRKYAYEVSTYRKDEKVKQWQNYWGRVKDITVKRKELVRLFDILWGCSLYIQEINLEEKPIVTQLKIKEAGQSIIKLRNLVAKMTGSFSPGSKRVLKNTKFVSSIEFYKMLSLALQIVMLYSPTNTYIQEFQTRVFRLLRKVKRKNKLARALFKSSKFEF